MGGETYVWSTSFPLSITWEAFGEKNGAATVAEMRGSDLSNGLLLRSDVHTLFDRGYVTITPSYEFRASRRLRTEFENGEE